MKALPARKAGGAARETLLCVHGSAANGRSWEAVAAALADRFDVLTPDRFGCREGVEWRAGTSASLEAEALHLAFRLCDDAQGAHVLAHSYGAAVAFELALRWPQLVRSLTLYEPARFGLLFHDRLDSHERDEILCIGALVSKRAVSGCLGSAAEMFVDYWSGAGAWHALNESQRGAMRGRMPKVAAEFAAAFLDSTPLQDFGRLSMPVRLIRGDLSPAPTRRIVDLLRDVMPHVEVVNLPGAGHMVPMTHPDRLIENLPHLLRPAAQLLVA